MNVQHLEDFLSKTTSHLRDFVKSLSHQERLHAKVPQDLLQELKESNEMLMGLQEGRKMDLNKFELKNLVACLDDFQKALQIFNERFGQERAAEVVASLQQLPKLEDNLLRVKESLTRGKRVERTNETEQQD